MKATILRQYSSEGKTYKPGDDFEGTEARVKYLVAMGVVELKKEKKEVKPQKKNVTDGIPGK